MGKYKTLVLCEETERGRTWVRVLSSDCFFKCKSVECVSDLEVCILRVPHYYLGGMYTYLTENIILKLTEGNWFESGMKTMKAS